VQRVEKKIEKVWRKFFELTRSRQGERFTPKEIPMSKTSNTARAKLPLGKSKKPETIAATCKGQVAAAQQCSDYPNQPAVQAAAVSTLNAANAVDATTGQISNLRAQIPGLLGVRSTQLGTLVRAHAGLETAIDVASNGQKQAIANWGAVVATRTEYAATTDAPADLTVRSAKGIVTAKVKADPTALVYVFQTGTDPAHPEAWPQAVYESASKHAFSGLPLGQNTYFRAAVIRRGTGQGQWSGIVECTVK
jgi:hypothetical protein